MHRLKRAFPQTPIAINGGIATMEAIKAQLAEVDGVMVGRAAYQNPELLLAVDPELFGEAAPFADAAEAIEAYYPTSSANWRGASVFRPSLGTCWDFSRDAPARGATAADLALESVQKGADLTLLRGVVEELRRDPLPACA